jgi:hemin uptake protein HemP
LTFPTESLRFLPERVQWEFLHVFPVPHGGAARPDQSPPAQPVHDARNLTGTEGTAFIVLDDKTYILRITKAGKLILTK